MAFRKLWNGEWQEGIFGRLLEARFRVLDELLDLDSVRAALGRPPVATAQGASAKADSAPVAVSVPTMFGSPGLKPLPTDAASPFVTSFLHPREGNPLVVLYQPGEGLAGGASLIVDAEKRQILTAGTVERLDITSGDDDQLVIGGGLANGTRLGGVAAGHEQIVLLNGADYSLSSADSDVEAGDVLAVIASGLGAGYGLDFDGSAELDGRFAFLGGAGADRLTGGSGDDDFDGGAGPDRLTGGDGADSFHYDLVSDSTGIGFDTLVGFDYGEDVLDLPVAVTGFDPKIAAGTLSGSSFDADLAAALGPAKLGAGHAAWFTPDAGDLAGQTFLVVDANGKAGYQAGEDFVFHMAEPPPPDLTGTGFFV